MSIITFKQRQIDTRMTGTFAASRDNGTLLLALLLALLMLPVLSFSLVGTKKKSTSQEHSTLGRENTRHQQP